jgi:hypothetical protein
MNTEILQFLDGTLAPDAEAELLHRLSVSPERRDLLRSFINQQVLFQRDRNTIAVPYAAEQKLWARLGEMMPPLMQNAAAPAVIEQVAATAPRTGIFNSVFSAASVAVICLLIGLGSGFLVGKNTNTDNTNNNLAATAQPLAENTHQAMNAATEAPKLAAIDNKTYQSYKTHNSSNSHKFSEAPLDRETADVMPDAAVKEVSASILPAISAITIEPMAFINSPDLNEPYMLHTISPFDQDESAPAKTFMQKWEFYFNEGIGKQFPNTNATNVSMPVVTNNAVSALYQPLANSHSFFKNFWVGASFGTANITVKKLRVELEDPLSKNSDYIMVGDLVHTQTTYGGLMLQYRIPEVFRNLALYGTVSGGLSSAAILGSVELGAHYDATTDVGFVFGVRGTRIGYSLDPSDQKLLSDGAAKGLKIPAGVGSTPPSYNLEISWGAYFHF